MKDSNKNPERILIVDDIELNVEILSNIIRAEGYETLCALNVKEAMEIMNDTIPQLILSDYSMPDMNGIEFCKLLKKNPKTRDIPFVFITVADSSDVKRAAFEAGGVDYIPKPFERTEVVMRVNNQINSYRAKKMVEEHNRNMYRVIKEQKAVVEREQENMLSTLVAIVAKCNSDMGEHMELVGCNCKVLAQGLQLTEKYDEEVNDEFVDVIYIASKLHDIGFLVLGDEVRNQELKSMTEDKEYIRKHTEEGIELLEEIEKRGSKSRFLDMALQIAKYHHSHWDGTGYPDDIKGNDIPLAARIVSVIDDFDIELRRRAGEDAAVENAVDSICNGSGTLYDPGIIEVFSKITKQLKFP